ncbi:multidrug and toxin extrusion protein 1-like [Halichoeres trimaculatus]|uniref:multidrug and toxin extrusion protein 1-like n=1 Tax=Halichoeres trimaculatus TaxID=147232 RepID=UPI003D9E8299
MESSSSSTSRSSGSDCFLSEWIRTLVPVGSKAEIIELCKLAGPLLLAQLLILAVGFVSTVFCGHLGTTELAGVTLAIAVINVTGISVGAGLAGACNTLISQTYGGRNLLRVGVILQRAVLILMLACFPCWAVLINTEPLLLAVKQKPEVARLAQLYVKIFMPALPATFTYALLTRYLQNQGIIWPQVVTGIVVNLFNALTNYIFLYVLDLGVAGSALANTLSQYSLATVLGAYIIWRGLHKETWGGWSRECLQDWGSYINLAIPNMIMLCVEWWTNEIGSFLAGLISEVEIGAQSVIYQLANVAYMFPFGFSIAGNVRVGNALGAGDTKQAKLSAKLTIFCAGSVSVCLAIIVGGLKHYISYVFTCDEQIRGRVADVMSLYAPFIVLDAIFASLGGIIRGAGKQKIGAICSIFGYYFVGFPIGVPLMFAAKMGIKGLWTGLFTCVFLQCSFLIIYLVRMDWRTVTEEAQIRAGVQASSTDTSKRSSQSDDPETLQGLTDQAVSETVVKPAERELPLRTLVLRRGLAVALMLCVLAAGIVMKFLITKLVT